MWQRAKNKREEMVWDQLKNNNKNTTALYVAIATI